MDKLDTNIENWSMDDILDLFGLSKPSLSEILATSNAFMDASTDPTIKQFIKQAQDKSMRILSQTTYEYDSYQEQASDTLLDWTKQQYLKQKDTTQANKVTSRDNTAQTFDDGTHFIMKRETIGVNQSFPIPVAQGTINPTQQNVVERTVIIDSQYRPILLPYSDCDINAPSYNTNFTVDLSDVLQNVLSMELYSIQIPQTWFNLSSALGNNQYILMGNSGDIHVGVIPDGYYNIDTFFNSDNYTRPLTDTVTLAYNINTNRVSIQSTTPITCIWFDATKSIQSNACFCVNTSFVNNNLGWLLGFRVGEGVNLTSVMNTEPVVASACPNFNGPQYFLLSVDDYQHNRLNKGIIGTVSINTKLALPTYYTADSLSQDQTGQCVAVMTAPRTLTQAQLYTINMIQKNRKRKKEYTTAPTTDNILAVLPLSGREMNPIQRPLVLFGINVRTNSRMYFGPVNIERLAIQLLDDKGNLVDLDGADWSFTFIVKQLYQY
jgi:hypothetical protein